MEKDKEIFVLYLVKLEDENLLKIGKTRKSNFNSRIYNIEKDFGKINYKNSYIIYSSIEREISTLEIMLHKSFHKDRLATRFKKGVGKTEWFKGSILKEVINQIKYLTKKNSNYKYLSSLKRLDNKKNKVKLINYFKNLEMGVYILIIITLLISILIKSM